MAEVLANDVLRGWLKLSALGGIEGSALVRLLREYPEPSEIFCARGSDLRRLVEPSLAHKIHAQDSECEEQAEIALQWLEQTPEAFVLTLADLDYPQGMLAAACPPAVLMCQGNRELLKRRFVTVLGSRSPSFEGERTALSFGKGLSRAGFGVLSPMMEGIDSACLHGALSDSSQAGIVLCATPLDRVYPAGARELFLSVLRSGLAVSHLLPGTKYCEDNLFARYQLLVAMCDAMVVMEAGVRSKALPLARQAVEMGKEVFAVPGAVSLPLSKGPNRLIREGARLVESAQDVVQDLTALSSPVPRLSDDWDYAG